jgi:hypothetical protein
MQVVIETNEQGVSWKLQTIPDALVLASSRFYFRCKEDCITDLGVQAREWQSFLPGRSVELIGHVQVVTDEVDGQTLLDLFPDLRG